MKNLLAYFAFSHSIEQTALYEITPPCSFIRYEFVAPIPAQLSSEKKQPDYISSTAQFG